MIRTILVDDSAFMRMMLKRILTENGIQVVGEADDGYPAIELYKQLKPDLVIMDITLPRLNGIDTVKELVRIDPDANIIMCSAMGQQSMVAEAIMSGALAFVVKPFEPEQLVKVVNDVFNSQLS